MTESIHTGVPLPPVTAPMADRRGAAGGADDRAERTGGPERTGGHGCAPALLPPGRPAPSVIRRRLIGRLRSTSEPVICVRAPAGYGKTTVLRQWDAVDGRPFVWVSLDDTDDDPLTLGSRLTAAITAVQPTPVSLQAVPPLREGFSRVVLPALGRRLAEATVPFVLVLDDVQVVTDPAAARLLSFLAGSMPTGCQVVFTSRCGFPVPVARLRTGTAGVCELGPADLEFDRHEAQLLLAHRGVSAEAVDAAVAAARGWPAGLCLVAGIITARGAAAPGMDAGLGGDRSVVDYLREQMWGELDAAEMTFLTRAAVLPEPTGAHCDVVLSRTGSGALLSRLAGGNVLLHPLDSADRRFRWHPLLRDALLSELERGEGAGASALHGRAAAALAADGDLAGAITAAIRAGDPGPTGTVVWQAASRAIGAGSPAAIRQWLEPLSDRAIASSVELSAASAWAAFLSGDARACDRWAAVAELGIDRRAGGADGYPGGGADGCRDGYPDVTAAVVPESGGTASPAVVRSEVAAAVELLAALRGDGRVWRAGVLDPLDPASDWQPIGRWTAAVHALLAGDRGEADRLLRQGELLADVLGSHLASALCSGLTAGLALLDRRSADSARAAGPALAALSSGGLDVLPLTALPRSVIAAVQAVNGELAAARHSLAAARQLAGAADGIAPWFGMLCTVFQARACLALRDLPTARALLRDAERCFDRGPVAEILRAHLEAAQSELAERCAGGAAGYPALTTAETRVLHFLPTQLSFPEIAGGLFVSRHTVKTQALAIYHKLGVSSRTAAVERARTVGLLPEPAGGR